MIGLKSLSFFCQPKLNRNVIHFPFSFFFPTGSACWKNHLSWAQTRAHTDIYLKHVAGNSERWRISVTARRYAKNLKGHLFLSYFNRRSSFIKFHSLFLEIELSSKSWKIQISHFMRVMQPKINRICLWKGNRIKKIMKSSALILKMWLSQKSERHSIHISLNSIYL